MRFLIAATVLTSALPAAAQRPGPDSAVTSLSRQLTGSGDADLAKTQLSSAYDAYEAAYAADPKNRAALVGMARVSLRQGLPGKAARFYREALALEPNDLTALAEQGTAFAQRGAGGRAQANLDRIRTLCHRDCPPAQSLARAIAAGPIITAEAAAPKLPNAPAQSKN